MLQRTKEILMITCLNLPKKEIDFHDSNLYGPTKIKDTVQWFPFITIMEHTANILKPNKGIITSLLKVFSMFELHLINNKDKLYAIAIRRINCKKATGVFLRNSTLE